MWWPFKKKQPEPECPYKLEPAPEPESNMELPKRDTTTTKEVPLQTYPGRP